MNIPPSPVVDVFVCGGYNGELILADLWKINLLTFQWSKLPAVMPEPAYFHCAAVTPVSPTPSLLCIAVWRYTVYIYDIHFKTSLFPCISRLAACTSTAAWWTFTRTKELALSLRSGSLCPAYWNYAGRSSSWLSLTCLHSLPCSCSTWASHRNLSNAWSKVAFSRRVAGLHHDEMMMSTECSSWQHSCCLM